MPARPAPPTSTPTPAAAISRGHLDSWLSRLNPEIIVEGPSADDLRASLSWRVTEPLRQLRVRERLNAARAGSLRLTPISDARSAASETALNRARNALQQRLTAIAPHLLSEGERAAAEHESVERLLGDLTARVRADYDSEDNSGLWLLMIGVSGCFPDQSQLLGLRRDLDGTTVSEAVSRVLNHSSVWMARHDSQYRLIDVETTKTVAVVDFVAKYGINSGVQRVTRELAKRWFPAGDLRLAALTHDSTAMRTLSKAETERVVNWSHARSQERTKKNAPEQTVIVPWNTTVFVPEVMHGTGAITLATLARYSPNKTAALVYDTIPASSGHFVNRQESLRFSNYLSMLKFFDEAVAISHSAAREFTAFSGSLVAQGLPGPRVRAVPLPIERVPERAVTADPTGSADSADSALPMVLTVGSNERRKNQLATVYAAETLWREGAQFSLQIVGGVGDLEYTAVGNAVAALKAIGRPIEIRRSVSEAQLAAAYAEARFSVFLALHEGYGLPVAESLAAGTPVLATNYGSIAEITEGGGCLTADPRDDDDIVDTMRRMLDDTQLAELRRQIAERSDSTWDDYVAEVRSLVADARKAAL